MLRQVLIHRGKIYTLNQTFQENQMLEQPPDQPARGPLWFSLWFSQRDDRAETLIAENRHVEDALQRHKREGVELAVRARTFAMLADMPGKPLQKPRNPSPPAAIRVEMPCAPMWF